MDVTEGEEVGLADNTEEEAAYHRVAYCGFITQLGAKLANSGVSYVYMVRRQDLGRSAGQPSWR